MGHIEMTEADKHLAKVMIAVMWEAEEKIEESGITWAPFETINGVLTEVDTEDAERTMLLMAVFADDELKAKAEEAISRYLEAGQ